MTTFQLAAPGRRRPRPRRMAAIRTMQAGKTGLCYPVTDQDVTDEIVCTGCKTPFTLGGYYAERPVGPNIVELVCLPCSAKPVLASGPVVYGQDRELPDPEGWVECTIPVVVVEGMRTGDGRLIPVDSLSGHRALPMSLLSLSRTSEGGHLDATVFGRIDKLERVPGPEVVNIDTGQPFPEGTFVWRSPKAYVDPDHPDYRLTYYGALTGLSVDLAETDAEFVEDEDNPGGEPVMRLLNGRIAAATVCTIPAFPGAHIVLAENAPAPGALAASALTSVRLAGESPFRSERITACRKSAQTASATSGRPGAAGSAAAATSGAAGTAPSPASPASAAAPPSSRPAASAPAKPGARGAVPSAPVRPTAHGTSGTSRIPSGGNGSASRTAARRRSGPALPADGTSPTPGTTAGRPASTSPGTRCSSGSETRTTGARSAESRSSSLLAAAQPGTLTSTTATPRSPSAAGSAARATAASGASSTARTSSEPPPTTSSGTPPISWFRDPGLTEPTPLTVTPEGQVYGHIACWDTPHIGLSGDVRPPRSHSDYAHFHVGNAEVLGDDGATTIISAGVLTMGTGHAELTAGSQAAAEHYDNTGSIAARVCAGEDEWGIWFSGAVDPDLDEVSRRRFLACGLSGDWRPFPGLPEPELVAALSVPTPGFPIPRARVAAGQPVAIVAAGAIRPKETSMSSPQPPTPPEDEGATIEPGTPVVLGDSGLSGVVGEVAGDTAIIAVEFPVADLTPADPPEGAELAAVHQVMDAMQAKIRRMEAQRVLDRV